MLCLVLLFSNYSNAQVTEVSTTSNLTNFTGTANDVTSTWQNAGSIGAPLTCWAGGDPGYCGPNPRVAANGAGSNIINFSYGTVDLHQYITIKNALPNSGTGLMVNGFNFGFTAKNGNGWDDGRQDYLTAYVKIYNNTNSKTLAEYNYDVNGKYNWTSFKYNETFTSAIAVPDLGNARIGFIGRDNNYWVGPYGPEISNTYFNLKYSVDPCVTNPYYSSSCAGYFDRLAALAPKSTTETTTTPVSANTQEPPPPPPPILGALTPQNNSLPPPPGPPPPAGQQPGLPVPGNQPQPGAPQQALAAVAVGPSVEKAGSPVNLSFALSLVAKNQEREKTLEQQTVQAALNEVQNIATKLQEQTAQTVATVNAQSATSVETGTALAASGQQSAGNLQTSSRSVGPQTNQTQFTGNGIQVTSMLQQQQGLQQQGLQQQVFEQQFKPQESSIFSIVPQAVQIQILGPTVAESAQTAQPTTSFSFADAKQQQEVQVPQSNNSFISDRNNPLKEIIESAQFTMSAMVETNTAAVKRDVQANEAAAGVDIAQMAIVPIGYANYSIALTDNKFYDTKPIYQNQRVIDNVRLLRGLGSDLKHQQMVQDQYR